MKRLMLLSTALIFSATLSMAAITANELVTAYQAKGYTRIEVKTGPTQIKVEAVKGNAKVEVVYDATTGAILSQESGRANLGDGGTGVELSTATHDFLGDGQGDSSGDDDSVDDENDDNSGSGSNDNDDNDIDNDDLDDVDVDVDDDVDGENDNSDNSGEGQSGKDD